MTTTRLIEITRDGISVQLAEITDVWGKALDPINALADARGTRVADVQPFVWGVLVAAGWTLIDSADRCQPSCLFYESAAGNLRCDIRPTLAYGGDLLELTVTGDCNGDDLPELVIKVEL